MKRIIQWIGLVTASWTIAACEKCERPQIVDIPVKTPCPTCMFCTVNYKSRIRGELIVNNNFGPDRWPLSPPIIFQVRDEEGAILGFAQTSTVEAGAKIDLEIPNIDVDEAHVGIMYGLAKDEVYAELFPVQDDNESDACQ